jgi:hypothetical protein
MEEDENQWLRIRGIADPRVENERRKTPGLKIEEEEN